MKRTQALEGAPEIVRGPDDETGKPPWESSPYRAEMLRDLDWVCCASMEWLANRSLARIHAWAALQIAKRGSCNQPIGGTVRKERRTGGTGRAAWRFVVYTTCDGYTGEREHGEYRTRHEARIQLGRFQALRWADELDPRFGILGRAVATEAPFAGRMAP